MGIPALVGKAQTVLGIIDPNDLGITLPHEHFLIDLSMRFDEPTAASEKLMAYQPVSLENLGWIRYHPLSNVDNLRFLDERVAISEGLRYKWAGGNSVIDVTNIGIGRDPRGLARISRATGLHIIMGSGYYVEEAKPRGTNLTEEMIAEELTRDITAGVDNTGIRAGILGEICGDWPLRDGEKTSYRAAARAQKQTGASIYVHPGRSIHSPFEIIDVLRKAGADISRVVISHIERTIGDLATLVRLAKTGCYIEYDLFSWEGWFPKPIVLSETDPSHVHFPCDAEWVNQIMALINEGFVHQILLSHDHCMKHRLWNYGGPGFAHILENVVPLMREKGMPEEHIRTLLVDNPKHIATFV